MSIYLTDRPGPKLHIAEALFGESEYPKERVETLQDYFAYYHEELGLLRRGISTKSWQTNNLAVKTYEDIFHVVSILRNHGGLRRPELRQLLSPRFPSSDILGLDRSMNLGIRLWLMINVQDAAFEGLRYEATSLQWDDERTLLEFLHSLFPQSRWHITPQSSRLGPHFTVPFMQRVCGLRLEWTTSLHDHLRLDRRRKALKIFPYKSHLQTLLSHSTEADDNGLPIPRRVLEETIQSLDLLFPWWDTRTVDLLEKEKQSFHECGPFEVTRTQSLLDFDYWRDRMLDLQDEIFSSPPASWTQLWRDRRNPQQFWTFWIALMILLLTVLSTAASMIQAWASLKALHQIH